MFNAQAGGNSNPAATRRDLAEVTMKNTTTVVISGSSTPHESSSGPRHLRAVFPRRPSRTNHERQQGAVVRDTNTSRRNDGAGESTESPGRRRFRGRGPPGLNRHNVRGNTMVSSSLRPLAFSSIPYDLFKLTLKDVELASHATMAMVRHASCCRSSMLCRPPQWKGSLTRRFRGRSPCYCCECFEACPC
jgi:hypothetical protein